MKQGTILNSLLTLFPLAYTCRKSPWVRVTFLWLVQPSREVKQFYLHGSTDIDDTGNSSERSAKSLVGNETFRTGMIFFTS